MYLLCSLILSFLSHFSLFAGFDPQTPVLTPAGVMRMIQMAPQTIIFSADTQVMTVAEVIGQLQAPVADYIRIEIEGVQEPLLCSVDQQFWRADTHVWQTAITLNPGDPLLTGEGLSLTVIDVQHIIAAHDMVTISIYQTPTFFVSERGLLAHNCPPMALCVAFAFGGGSIEFAGASFSLAFLGAWFGLNIGKNKVKNKETSENTIKVSPTCSLFPGDPDDEDPYKRFRKGNGFFDKQTNYQPHGRYENAPYHTPHGNSNKSPCPRDGQRALDNSIAYSERHRIAIEGDMFVVLRYTSPGVYHGYLSDWSKLSDDMQRALQEARLVNPRGKIL